MESFTIISKIFEGKPIRQREEDGYISATDMCKLFNEKLNNYTQLKSSESYFKALESDVRIPVSKLVQIRKGGIPTEQGTWVHPLVATHLAQWLSPKFAIQVSKWAIRYLAGDIALVKDVIEQHDKVHDTTTTAEITTTDNELIRRKQLAEIEEIEERVKKMRVETKQKELNIIDKQKELIKTLNENFTDDPQLFSAYKNSVMNILLLTAPADGKANTENDFSRSKDISELYRSAHNGKTPSDSTLKKIGLSIKKEFLTKHPGKKIHKTQKHCNGSIRYVNSYPPEDEPWILEIIRKY